MRYNENNKRDIEKTRVHCAFGPPSIDDRHKMLWRHGNKTGKWTVEHINVIIAHIVVHSALQFDAVAVCCNLAAHFSNSPFGYVYGAAPPAPPPHRYGQSSSQIPQFPTWPSTGTVYTPHTPEQQKNLITISYVFIYWAIKTRSQNLIITPLHRTMRMRIHTYSYYIFIPCFQETNKSLIDFLL